MAARLGLAAAPRIVLTYHRVATPTDDPFALAVPPEWFAAHLEILRSRTRVEPLEELIGRRTRGRRPRSAVTFDDGYRDTLVTAVPLLRAAQVPVTVFVATGYLGDVRGYWWDRLASAVRATGSPLTALAGIPGLGAIPGPEGSGGVEQMIVGLAAAIQPLEPAARDAVIAEIEARLPARDDTGRELHPILDAPGVRELAAEPLVEIGGHTVGHAQLSALTPVDQISEIGRGLDALEVITGRRPDLLAYPYGGAGDYDHRSCAAAEASGVRAAFTNHHRRFDPVGDRFRIPRWSVPPVAPDRFAEWLDRALAT